MEISQQDLRLLANGPPPAAFARPLDNFRVKFEWSDKFWYRTDGQTDISAERTDKQAYFNIEKMEKRTHFSIEQRAKPFCDKQTEKDRSLLCRC